MLKRTITGVIMLAILVPLIAAPQDNFAWSWFEYVGIALAMIAAYEMMNMFYKKSPCLKIYRYIIPIFVGIIVYMVYLSASKGLVFNEIVSVSELWSRLLNHFWLLVVFLIAIAVVLIMIIFTKNSTAHDMMACVMTLVYCGLAMGYVVAIKYLMPMATSFRGDENFVQVWGGRSFGYLYTIVCVSDVAAYLFGSKFGRHKLCPDISPKKTVEGAIAGLVFGTIIGTACIFLYRLVNVSVMTSGQIWVTIFAGLLISAVLSFCVQIGDLIASKLKRSYEIKDFGKVFPGHGGVLDRFDSLIFSGMVYYIIIQFIQLVIIGVQITSEGAVI